MARTLVVVRHAKSDWSGDHTDRDRPLSPRGRRQAPEAGRWLAAHGPGVELAVVSPAARAVATWELVAAELPARPPVRVVDAAYGATGEELLDLVRGLDAALGCVAVVAHLPGVEDLVELLTGEVRRMPTSCLAVVDLETGSLRHHGRPPS